MPTSITTKHSIISPEGPTYFIADIAANHDGSLSKALELIERAAEAGANAAKFQHFRAESIVSDYGFRRLGSNIAHQAQWKESVFDVYKAAELNIEWTESLLAKCDEVSIDFFSAVYDLKYIDYLEEKMPFFKIGSGDIDWWQAIDRLVITGKPIFLATGASYESEVSSTVARIPAQTKIVLMQCNTNYTASDENYKYLNLKVLETYKHKYPNVILGLSDHTDTADVILGAVALGARVIERHFTDDRTLQGPDHKFSLDPRMWGDMVNRVRRLEIALGSGVKIVEENEIQSRIVQRRAIRAARDLKEGEILSDELLVCLRPCPKEGLSPAYMDELIGKRALTDLDAHEVIPRDWLTH